MIFTLVGSLIISACTNVDALPPKVDESADKTAPVITVEGEREYLVHLGKTVYLPKITATDDVDDELTSKIVVKHGEEEVASLAANENTLGFLLQPMGKSQLFRGVIAGGILPRKTFSMGHAREKRYYLEGRRIK